MHLKGSLWFMHIETSLPVRTDHSNSTMCYGAVAMFSRVGSILLHIRTNSGSVWILVTLKLREVYMFLVMLMPSTIVRFDLTLHHREVEKIKAWSYSRNCANDPLTVSVGVRGYMYSLIT